MYLTGILQALGIVLITTLFNVYIRTNSLLFHIEPLVFACTYLISTALTLSLVAGPGRFVHDTLKTPATWFYGFVLVGTFTVDIYLARYISGTEVSILSRMAVPISFFLAFYFANRKPLKTDLYNIVALTTGMLVILALQQAENLKPILVLGALSALLQAVVFMISETHKQSVTAQQIGNLRDRARVVGFVTFITSMIFFGLAFGISFLKMHFLSPDYRQLISFVPDTSQFTHGPTIWSGFIFGLILSPFTRYFQWSSSYKIKTENVLTVLAIIPLTTLFCEWALSFHPLFAVNRAAVQGERGAILLLTALLMAGGAWYSAYLRFKKEVHVFADTSLKDAVRQALEVKSSSIHHTTHARDDYDVICAAIEYAEGNKAKAAALLDIPASALNVLYEGRGALALTATASQKLHRTYRKRIASCDALTGLLNRGGFMADVKKMLETTPHGTLFFIDLDKFKPVNDTYGHEAGDRVLQGVAKHLQELAPKNALVARLGGDEFCVLIPNLEASTAFSVLQQMQETIAVPFTLKAAGAETTIAVTASIGVAHYPQDGTAPDELLKKADSGMYREKQR